MQWVEIKIAFDKTDDDVLVDQIADIFYTLGAKGVVIDDPHLEPPEGWGADALPLPEQPAVTGFLPLDDRIGQSRRFLEQSLIALAKTKEFHYTLSTRAIEEEDWAQSWKVFFQPQKITERLVVKPTWADYQARPDELVIEIDPGMAFGTGGHPTTALCLGLLEEIVATGHHVLDVGTGSGILLIAAAKLGATRLCGVDVDPMALEVSHANLLRNALQASAFELYCGPLVEPVVGLFEVVVANILADVVIDLLDRVRCVLKPGGAFICSGIIENQQEEVARKMESCGISISHTRCRQEWVALAGRLDPLSGGRP